MSTIYALMNKDAISWPYHDTREKQRRSIKQKLETWRKVVANKDKGAHLSVGRFGSILYYAEHGRLSYPAPREDWIEIATRLGIPVIDTRTVPEDRIIEYAFRTPMPAVGVKPDPEPYNGLSYAPLTHIIAVSREAGATVINGD